MDMTQLFKALERGGDLTSILIVCLSVSFTLMISVFHYSQLKKNMGDFKAFMIYFSSFFSLFFLIPGILIFIFHPEPWSMLRGVGFQMGNLTVGIIAVVLFVPIAKFAAFVGSRDPNMKAQYPFSKEACKSDKLFVVYEVSYLVLYYFTWEFLFRGLLFFPISEMTNLPVAIAVTTILSTLYHIGHPLSEIYGAFVVGFLFGIIAFLTSSFLYVFVIHAMIGIMTDVSLYRKFHRKLT